MTRHVLVWEGTGGAFFDFSWAYFGRLGPSKLYHRILALSIQELGRTTVSGREKG
jgi:hypothetical protein